MVLHLKMIPILVVDTVCCDGSTKKFAGSSIPGMMFRGKGDYVKDSIFFPAAGVCGNGNFSGVGVCCYYWSSVPDVANIAWHLSFNGLVAGMSKLSRDRGRSVRTVWSQK